MKTFNVYWLFITCLVIWFLFIYSPNYFYTTHTIIDIPFGIHLWGYYSFSIVFIINTLVTPSTYGANKNYHNRIGQYGMIMGLIEIIFGIYCCLYAGVNKLPPLSFSIVTGIEQLIFQFFSYASIKSYQSIKKQIIQKKESLQLEQQHHPSFSNQAYREIQLLEIKKLLYLLLHITLNILLFTFLCGAPALMCLIRKFAPDNDPIAIVAIVFLPMFSTCYITYLQKYIIVQPITDNVDGVVVVDPIQNNNGNNINTSTELTASCIDTTTTTTRTETNTNNASISLLQQP